MNSALTTRQAEVYDYIQQHREKKGYPPSSREIQAHFGFASQTAAMNHLNALRRKGCISRRYRKARVHAPLEPGVQSYAGARRH